MNVLGRSSIRILLQRRHIHATPVAFKKNPKTQALEDDFFDDEVVEDLIPSSPAPQAPSSAPSPTVASTSSSPAPPTKKNTDTRLTPGARLHRFTTLVQFVRPRIGRNPRKHTPLVRRSAFPQLIQLATTPAQMHTISEMMAIWKEGRLGTQGRARIGADGLPKGAQPFDEATSELFARRCDELGIPEHALSVFGAFPTYALPLTLPAGRRLLHALAAAERPLADVITAAALYTAYDLPPVQEDLPSCALLLSACLRHIKNTPAEEGGQGRKQAETLLNSLVGALQARLSTTPPMPASRDVQEKTVRRWLKGVMLELDAFLKARGKEGGKRERWLERWMVKSRFVAN